MKWIFLLFTACHTLLFSELINTFYGPVQVEEPVLLELIHSPAMQRLKHIHQYGVAYYTTHTEPYNRYDHSLGVFVVLRIKGASLEEQIAGLLHDVSHTVFSHVGDWIFGRENQDKDYQTLIYNSYLQQAGIEAILNKHGFTVDQVSPSRKGFLALEQPLPNLCADRIDYNIQGAFYQNFITHHEALEILDDLQFVDNAWISTRPDLMEKLVRYSIFMTEDCWGSVPDYLASRWLADALLRAVDIGIMTRHTIHFGTDDPVWNQLLASDDPHIQNCMQKVLNTEAFHRLVNHTEATLIVKSKFRGIDPLINHHGHPVRLTSLNPDLFQDYTAVKEKMAKGWAIKLIE